MVEIFPIDFAAILAACGVKDASAIRHMDYLRTYLEEIGAKTAVVEREYVDRDYIEDYAKYYSRCFRGYSRLCCRIHFFAREYIVSDIEAIITSTDNDVTKECQKGYLGFVVLKPLAETIIGRTCLVPYAEDCTCRNYKALCDVRVSFFGQPLFVRCMPFQEQDSTVAACATCALWSSFKVAAANFGIYAPSPVCITETATEHGLSAVRRVPNPAGLTLQDMVYAIRKVGLDVVCVNQRHAPFDRLRMNLLLGNIYAYLGLGIPIVLLGKLKNANGGTIGGHAVAVAGYHIKKTLGMQCALSAMRIDKLYVHDDQVGPYSRVEVGDVDFVSRRNEDAKSEVRSRLSPEVLLIPLYHKIRVEFKDVWDSAMEFDGVLHFAEEMYGTLNIEWDIKLRSSNQLKQLIRSDLDVPNVIKLAIMVERFPRFVWCALLTLDGEKNALFVVDATDVGQGLHVIRPLFLTDDLPKIAETMLMMRSELWRNPFFAACVDPAKMIVADSLHEPSHKSEEKRMVSV